MGRWSREGEGAVMDAEEGCVVEGKEKRVGEDVERVAWFR